LAYRNIKANTGSATKGTDGRVIKDIADMTNEQVIAMVRVRLRRYKPQSVRRVEIPKEDGKIRPLGIPTISDRLIQQSILQILEPICEEKFHNHSFGFRPNEPYCFLRTP
jgi:RNA-directed DNA polymerase